MSLMAVINRPGSLLDASRGSAVRTDTARSEWPAIQNASAFAR